MLQDVWGSLIAWYLFLAGVGAGAYLVAVVADNLNVKSRLTAQRAFEMGHTQNESSANLPGKGYALLVKPGVYLGGPLVAIGSLLLLLEVGQPFKFIFGFLHPGTSMISVGMWIMTSFMFFAFIHLLTVFFKGFSLSDRALRLVEAAGGILAICTAGYTGILLGVIKSIPFWNNPMLPVLFMVSAISTGIAAVILISFITAKKDELMDAIHGLVKIDLWLITGELLLLFFLMFVMSKGNQTAVASVQFLLSGGYALVFWGGLILIGLLIPLLLEVFQQRDNMLKMVVIASVCLLIGGICLRYSILAAGMPYPVVL